jgi:ribulose-phosphate 3-epimerase
MGPYRAFSAYDGKIQIPRAVHGMAGNSGTQNIRSRYGDPAMKLIAPSILSADFTKLADEIRAVEAAGADWIHVDVMDGHFVPNITMGPLIVEAVRRVTELPIDVHLMIENPDRYIPEFVRAGASWVSVQAEACVHLHRSLQLIREQGARPGVVLNPGTSLGCVRWVLEYLDYVLIMSVNPGFGGQAFIPTSLDKIKVLHEMLQTADRSILIEVDGGVKTNNVKKIAAAGADVFVAGSAIFGTTDYGDTLAEFRKQLTDLEE